MRLTKGDEGHKAVYLACTKINSAEDSRFLISYAVAEPKAGDILHGNRFLMLVSRICKRRRISWGKINSLVLEDGCRVPQCLKLGFFVL